MTDDTKAPREFGIIEKEHSPDQVVHKTFPGAIRVIEKLAYDALRAELACEKSYADEMREKVEDLKEKLSAALAEVERLKRQISGEDIHPGHKHFIGKTYEMKQENFNKLIAELDAAKAEIERLHKKSLTCCEEAFKFGRADRDATLAQAKGLRKVLGELTDKYCNGHEDCPLMDHHGAITAFDSWLENGGVE